MYLLIDAGNTRIKVAFHDGRHWLEQRACTLDAFELQPPPGFTPSRIVIANVAGVEVAARLQRAIEPHGAPVEWLQASARRCGLRNDYQSPVTLGADRWAAAIGAWNALHDACLVVCAGTATTLDLLRADGSFAGGCILPGLDMMLDALARNTAGLPRSRGDWQMPPRNTDDAIATGCLLAQIGAIRAMADQLPAHAPILLAGGNAERLQRHLGERARLHPGLVLDGLLCIATNGGAN